MNVKEAKTCLYEQSQNSPSKPLRKILVDIRIYDEYMNVDYSREGEEAV